MTKKDFEFMASTLKWMAADKKTCLTWGLELMQNYPKFDLDRFMDACGHGFAKE